MKAFLTLCIFSLVAFSSFGQYSFASKEEKKLYTQLEKYYNNYDFEKILAEEERMLQLFEPKQDTLTALMYAFLFEAYTEFGDIPTAYEYGKKELALRTKIDPNNTEEIKNTTFMLAQYADELGLFNEAEAYYTDVLESDKKMYGQSSPEYIESAMLMASFYGNTLSMEKAKDGIKLLRSLNRFIDKNTPYHAIVSSQLGYLHYILGSNRQAEKHFATATEGYDRLGLYASRQNISNLNYIGQFYKDQGKFPEAEKVFNEAIAITNRLPGENDNIINLLKNNIASVYIPLGNFDAAERNLQEAIEILQNLYGPASYPEAISITSLGVNYYWQENYDEAEKQFNKALEILVGMGAENSFDYINIINNLSNIYKQRGNYEKALSYAQEANTAFKNMSGENSIGYVKSLYNIGEIHMMRGDDKAGEKQLKEAQKIGKNFLGAYHPEYGRITLKLAINQWAQGNIADAEQLYAEVFNNYFEQIDNYFPTLSEEEKTKFYNNKIRPAFEQFNSFIVAKADENDPLLATMYDFQLATKGLLLYATNRVRESIMGSGDSTLIEKYGSWIDQMEQLSKLYSSTGQGVEDRDKKIDSLYQSANQMEKELSEASVAFAGTYAKNRLSWEDVRNHLKVGEAAVEMIRFRKFDPKNGGKYTDEVLYGGLVVKHDTQTQPELILIENGNQIESRGVTTYRNAIKYRMEENYSYRFFWAPLEEKLADINKVYFSPDGVYNQISLYTLLNPATNKYLIEEIDMQLLTNTKDLVQLVEEHKATELVDKPLLFGFPNYNMGIVEETVDLQEVASSVSSAASLGRGEARGTRGTRGGNDEDPNASAVAFIGNTRGSSGLSRGMRGNLQRYMSGNNLMALLPGTKVEVESISTILNNLNQVTGLFTGSEATEEEIKQVKNPLTLHIATHGFFLEQEKLGNDQMEDNSYAENPLLRSGLIMAGANSFIAAGVISDEHEEGNDGILTAYEAMNLNLTDTDLVVLSACETGLGEISNGEGVYGLQRAFQVAGAKTIIMSMWTVDDEATQELMTNFYSEWVKTGNRQKSFISAQRIIKDKYKDPYFWGAFVMIGE